MKRFIITDTFDGRLVFTNDEEKAKEHALCEDYFVYDVQTETVILTDGQGNLINEPIEELS